MVKTAKIVGVVGNRERGVVVSVDDAQTMPTETEPFEWWHKDKAEVEGLLLKIAELSPDEDAFIPSSEYPVADYKILIPEQAKYPTAGFGFYLRFNQHQHAGTLEAYPFVESGNIPSPLVDRIDNLFPNAQHWNTYGLRSRFTREGVSVHSWRGISIKDLREFGASTPSVKVTS